jgi:hypothetical protein
MVGYRPIKIHCSGRMRDHFEFMARRHLVDLNADITRIKGERRLTDLQRRVQLDSVQGQIDLTLRCIKEATEAGT